MIEHKVRDQQTVVGWETFDKRINRRFSEADRRGLKKIIAQVKTELRQLAIEQELSTEELFVVLLRQKLRERERLNASWQTLRREAMTTVDSAQRLELTSRWWLENVGRKLNLRARHLFRKHPPDLDACAEVYTKRKHRLEQAIYTLLLLMQPESVDELTASFAEGGLDEAWRVARDESFWWRVRAVALQTFELLFPAQSAFGPKLAVMRKLTEIINDEQEHPFVRVRAAAALAKFDSRAAEAVVDSIFGSPLPEGDQFIFRRNVLVETRKWKPDWRRFLKDVLLTDPSPAVRQKAAQLLLETSTEPEATIYRSIAEDDAHEVRASWTLVLESNELTDPAIRAALETAAEHIERETDSEVLLASLRALAFWLYQLDEQRAERLSNALSRLAERLNQCDLNPQTFVWIRLCAELAQTLAESETRVAFDTLRTLIQRTPEGHTFRPPKIVSGLDSERLRSVLSCAASLDFGLYTHSLDPDQIALQRGFKRSVCWWRILHELRHPAYDKRQAHSHLTGLVAPNRYWFQPLVMAEVTRTRIPGERVYLPPFGFYAAHIPGATEAYNLGASKRLTISVPGCTTTLEHNASAALRTLDKFKTAWRFAQIEDDRFNALRLGDRSAAHNYLLRFEKQTNLSVEFESFSSFWEDLLDWHTALLPWGFIERVPFLDYVLSPHGNTLAQLAVLAALVGTFITGRALWRAHNVRKWRASLPLCIGGWGSRGKSGTERLKAALFHGLGYQVFSKTTGTQAMFISSIPGQDPMEIPLFRPYDKATIFEQLTVLEQAYRMDAQVFLWECMALNPRYVQILSHDWMKDDFATVTNTYPDHEDIQGPTGYDVANTISLFLPKNARAVTCEQQMFPVLLEAAKQKNTKLRVVAPALPYILPREFLARYPYLEHPLNIALILTLCDELGVDRDVALTITADYIVPDIGALKTYPETEVSGRRMDFSNTMSANERAGFLASFERLGFHKWDARNNLAERVVLVVNNRADRPARSHVFAKVIAEDTAVNAIVVIGTAVNEFGQFLLHYLGEFYSKNSKPVEDSPEGRRRWLDTILRPMRRTWQAAREWHHTIARWLQTDPESVRNALTEIFTQMVSDAQASLEFDKIWRKHSKSLEDFLQTTVPEWFKQEPADQLVRWVGQELGISACITVLERQCDTDTFSQTVAPKALDFAKRLFESQITIIEEPLPKGEKTMRVCASVNPYGSRVHLVGCQNIKGAGLEFVKVWLELENVMQKLKLWEEGNEFQRNAAFDWLARYGPYSPYAAQAVLKALERKGGPNLERLSIEEAALYKQLEPMAKEEHVHQPQEEKPSGQQGWLARFVSWLFDKLATVANALVDFPDSIRRRYEADLVWELLALQLVSHKSAAERLNWIYKRQKVGPVLARKH